jgi:hypothetical protein
MSAPFKGGWEADFEPWRNGLDEVLHQRDATQVKIMSWGPGQRSPGYEKRVRICEHLSNGVDSVYIMEQLLREDPRLKQMADKNLYDAEEVAASEADLVICLIPAAGGTGAYGEILKYHELPYIAPKIRVLIPKEAPKTGGGFIYRASQGIPEEHVFRYRRTQFETCEDIRAKCSEWVAAVRHKKFMDAWRKSRSPVA